MGSFQDAECLCSNNVVITGFGPFRDHLVNPSWEAIKDPIKIDRPVNVIVKQVSVAYDTVDVTIPELWSTYKPLLMVHVGLAAHDSTLRLETQARSGPYLHPDVTGCFPACSRKSMKPSTETIVANSNSLESEGDVLSDDINNKNDVLSDSSINHTNTVSGTCLKLDSVIEKFKKAKEEGNIKLDISQSYDAGLYVCEYIYHKSLCHNSKAVFIHIPDTDRYSLDEIKEALKLSIELLIDGAMES